MMLKNIVKIDFDNYSESIPSFLALIMMPVTGSIAEGMMVGFISYIIIKLVGGKAKEVHPILYVVSALFILNFFV